MLFSGQYKDILSAATVQWQVAQGAVDKKFVLSTIVQNLRDVEPSEDQTTGSNMKRLPSDDEVVMKSVRTWMSNAHLNSDGAKGTSAKGKWTGTSVYSVLHKAQIDIRFHQLMEADLTPRSGNEKVSRHSETALLEVWKELSEEERGSLRLQALNWNSDGEEAAKYLQNVDHRAKRVEGQVKKFLEKMKQEYGADIFMLLKYDDKNMDRKVHAWQETSSQGFANFHPEWSETLWNKWTTYGGSQTQESGLDQEQTCAVTSDKKSWAVLKHNSSGYPLLPSRPLRDHLEGSKKLIRDFTNEVWTIDMAGSKTPWRNLSDSAEHEGIVAPNSLPAGVQFMDPSRMKREMVDKIYSHWLQRQNNGEIPLAFHKLGNCSKADAAPTKRHDHYEETDDDDGHPETAGEVPTKVVAKVLPSGSMDVPRELTGRLVKKRKLAEANHEELTVGRGRGLRCVRAKINSDGTVTAPFKVKK